MKARSNPLQAFAQLALVVARRVIPAHSHKFAPKTYTQPQLLACLLVKEHLGLDYRGAQDLLELSDGLRSALSLRQAPDHSTLWWFAQHKVTPELLQQALAETVRTLHEHEPPSSPPTGSGPPERKKSGRQQVALDSTGLFFCRAELMVESLIPAYNRRGTQAKTPYRRKMQRLLGVRGTERRGTHRARRDYAQRWKAETLVSVLKRKWGECLNARDAAMQQLQALLRSVVYNLHRLTMLGVFCCVQLLSYMLLQRTFS